jgi:hypothetical protein
MLKLILIFQIRILCELANEMIARGYVESVNSIPTAHRLTRGDQLDFRTARIYKVSSQPRHSIDILGARPSL